MFSFINLFKKIYHVCIGHVLSCGDDNYDKICDLIICENLIVVFDKFKNIHGWFYNDYYKFGIRNGFYEKVNGFSVFEIIFYWNS